MRGNVHSIETLGALDGPGVRCVVFLQGCPMRCRYCHNPDTWNSQEGALTDSSQIVQRAIRYKPYFGPKGGLTLSGGEPFMQAEFVAEILGECKKNHIHTAVDTCGYYLNNIVARALKFTDLVILDIKHTDPQKHEELTGRKLANTLRFLDWIATNNIPLWIRQVVVPGWNDSKQDMKALAGILRGVPAVEKVELLPYHTMGIEKWNKMGLSYTLHGVPEPEPERIEVLRRILEESMGRGI